MGRRSLPGRPGFDEVPALLELARAKKFGTAYLETEMSLLMSSKRRRAAAAWATPLARLVFAATAIQNIAEYDNDTFTEPVWFGPNGDLPEIKYLPKGIHGRERDESIRLPCCDFTGQVPWPDTYQSAHLQPVNLLRWLFSGCRPA